MEPAGSMSISHQERTTWALPDLRGSSFTVEEAEALLTGLLKSILWETVNLKSAPFKWRLFTWAIKGSAAFVHYASRCTESTGKIFKRLHIPYLQQFI